MSRRPFTITKVERCAKGYWTARVTVDGETIVVDRQHGSWMATIRNNGNSQRVELMPYVAAALQEKLPLSERRPKINKKKETKT